MRSIIPCELNCPKLRFKTTYLATVTVFSYLVSISFFLIQLWAHTRFFFRFVLPFSTPGSVDCSLGPERENSTDGWGWKGAVMSSGPRREVPAQTTSVVWASTGWMVLERGSAWQEMRPGWEEMKRDSLLFGIQEVEGENRMAKTMIYLKGKQRKKGN